MNEFIKQVRENQRLLLTVAAVVIPAGIILLAVARFQESDPIETITAYWAGSGHADYTSQSFNHWNDGDPPQIPPGCAACHSSHGLLEFVGQRGTPAGSISQGVPIGTVISCIACHNASVHHLDSVPFPSRAMVEALTGEAGCLLCHQGWESTVGVNAVIAGLDDDTVYNELAFIDVHYKVAAATMMGTTAKGGYEYPDMTYVGRFEHTQDFQACSSCHDPHNLRVDPLLCSTCHVHVTRPDDLRLIREDPTDYDGDGNTRKGIALEIDSFHALLYEAIQNYADEVIGTPLLYSSTDFPYFFVDVSNGQEIDPADLGFENRYTEWTPRLVRAAYNYHFVHRDPGAYSHNPRYVLQLLYDSLRDINERLPVEMSRLQRP